MPPKERISKQMIMEATFSITRSLGFNQVNARSLGQKLACSTQPIYSRFSTMEDVKRAFLQYLELSFADYVQSRKETDNPLLQTCFDYIYFAKDEPNLFSLLFMTYHKGRQGKGKTYAILERLAIVDQLSEISELDRVHAHQLYRQVIFYAHGVAVMISTRQLILTDSEIKEHLQETYEALLHYHHQENYLRE